MNRSMNLFEVLSLPFHRMARHVRRFMGWEPSEGDSGVPGVPDKRSANPRLNHRASAVNPSVPNTHHADSLEGFHELLRQYKADRIFIDVRDIRLNCPGYMGPSYWIMLSASTSNGALIARLPRLGAADDAESKLLGSALAYAEVLRSRFQFHGYATSGGYCSIEIAEETEGFQPPPPHEFWT
jgi:hypothetical protein